MLASTKHKFICLNPPKTGTGYREDVLFNYIENIELSSRERHLNVSRAKKYLKSKQLGRFEDYFCFTFVRNPWRRMESWYQMVFERESLQEPNEKHFFSNIQRFLSNCGKNTGPLQSYILEENNCYMDYVGSLETMQSDLKKISKEINISLHGKRYDSHGNEDLRKRIKSLWTKESIEFVAKKERYVIELKNYSYE